jgi:ribulose-5-phosphate 4-epimerase/fuculose-1-phosphate aldolase
MIEAEIRALMVSYGRSLFERGYGCGTSGNLSVKLDDGDLLLTPTNVSLGSLTEDDLTRLSETGAYKSGRPATKEDWLHLAFYRGRPQARAVVHLHSTHAVAMACLEDLPPSDAIPPITPYAVMRFGAVAMIPYFRPGDQSFAGVIEAAARDHKAILLANHGPVVAGPDLPAAIAAAEELEETARLFFILRGHRHRVLTEAEVQELYKVFGK